MSDDLTCHVCARTVTERGLLADCDGCGKRYHLNPRSDVEGIDCGDVWAGDDDAPALQFSCQPCLDAVRDQAPAPGAQATPPGMPLPPGAPPEALAALAGFAAPAAPPAPPDGPAPAPGSEGSSQPPRLGEWPRQRRRFRRIDG